MDKDQTPITIAAIGEVYQTASNLMFNVRRRLTDIESMWTLYARQGIVPETNVFRSLQNDIDLDLDLLEQQRARLCCRVAALQRPKGMRPDASHKKLTGDINETVQEISKSPSFKIYDKEVLSDTKTVLFDKVLLYSEALTYLTQHLNSRAGTLSTSEATHGSNLTMHRFSGVQTIYDAAESLMSDYASILGNHDYQGLVVFGYNYQAAAWTEGLTTFPLFAEHPNHLPMLVILAHEAAHWLQDTSPLAEFRQDIKNRLDCLMPANEKFSFVPLLGKVSVDTHTRFHPVTSAYRRLAGEIASDVFATLVTGGAYPRILAKYFLPLFVDTVIPLEHNSSRSTDDLSWVFYVSSFKLRVSVETARIAGLMDDKEADRITAYISDMDVTLTDIAGQYSESIPDNQVLTSAVAEALATNSDDLPKETRPILEAIAQNMQNVARDLVWGTTVKGCPQLKPSIISLFRKRVKAKAYREIISRPAEAELRRLFSGSVDLRTIMEIWQNPNGWQPRHLISLLVPHFGEPADAEINAFAVIYALAHHPSILNRYQAIQI